MSRSVAYWRKPKAPHSRVKSAIVSKYFVLWSSVMKKQGTEVGYLDLYAGKGEGENGEPSTAVQVLCAAARDSYLRQKLVAVLNDIRPSYCEDMRAVLSRKGYDTVFKCRPKVTTAEVGELLAEQLSTRELIPTLCFIDPYGFKGVTLNLIRSIIKDWGCDIILFFYTSGINRNLTVPQAKHDLQLLFGDLHYRRLMGRISTGKEKRGVVVLDEFQRAAKRGGANTPCRSSLIFLILTC